MNLLLILPFCESNRHLAKELINRIHDLGGCPNNDLVLIAANAPIGFNLSQFKSAITLPPWCCLPDERHPIGPNIMFETALKYIRKNPRPFLWLEPDAVPLRKGWLQEIEAEYAPPNSLNRGTKTIVAHVARLNDPEYPKAIPSGVAVYPPEAPDLFNGFKRNIAWDIQFADRLMPLVHESKTIVNRLNHQNAPTFVAQKNGKANEMLLSDIPKEAALFHPCKDGSLNRLLGNKPDGGIRSVFYHSGDFGDIIYSLPAIREFGGGDIAIGPDNRTNMATRQKLTPELVRIIIPLLESQPYIHKAWFSEEMPAEITRDLNQMRLLLRSQHLDLQPNYNLARCYLAQFQLALENDQKQWLAVGPNPIAPVIVNRSSRYNNAEFRWDRIMAEYRGQIAFVGHKTEHTEFVRQFGKVPYHPTKDFLEAAQVIAGSKLFVGNQSCCYAIAEGLKHNAILEHYPPGFNTSFPRKNSVVGVTADTVLPVIERKTPTKRTPLVIRAPVDTFSGFGQFVRNIAVRLARRGHKVAVSPINKEGAAFQSDIPKIDSEYQALLVPIATPAQVIISMCSILPELIKGNEVVMTMWETTRISPEITDALNKASRVIVPSDWNACCFNACGVDTPISITPLGIDTKIYYPERYTADDHKFVFGTAGRYAHGGIRKGIDDVIKAFELAFQNGENVELRVKCFSDCKIETPKQPNRIVIHREFMPNLGGWYRNLDCFVTAARGEGWGLHVHEAMACGIPVAAPQHGALAEFFDSSCGWPIQFNLGKASGDYEGCGLWAVPSIDSMSEMMRTVFIRQTEAKKRGRFAALRAARFSVENMVDKFESVLMECNLL